MRKDKRVKLKIIKPKWGECTAEEEDAGGKRPDDMVHAYTAMEMSGNPQGMRTVT